MTRPKPLTLAQLQGYANPVFARVIKPVFICPICGKHHPDQTALQDCMASTEKALATPGDIVVIENGYGWRDGLDDWLFDENGYEFHGKKTLRFWYVITAITQYDSIQRDHTPGPEGDPRAHQISYHLQTLGLHNGMPEGRGGWTTPVGHTGWKLPKQRKPPASVVEAAKGMIGRTFTNLL